MFRSKFISSALVLMVGVNLSAWAISVGTSAPGSISVMVPISSQAMQAQAFSASAASSLEDYAQPTSDTTVSTSTIATTSPDTTPATTTTTTATISSSTAAQQPRVEN